MVHNFKSTETEINDFEVSNVWSDIKNTLDARRNMIALSSGTDNENDSNRLGQIKSIEFLLTLPMLLKETLKQRRKIEETAKKQELQNEGGNNE